MAPYDKEQHIWVVSFYESPQSPRRIRYNERVQFSVATQASLARPWRNECGTRADHGIWRIDSDSDPDADKP
jgi:hypothetical protein